MPEKIYSLEELANLLQVSERTLMREIKQGKLHAFKVGRALRFTPEAVQEYINNQQVKPGDDLGDDSEGDEE